MSVKERIKKFCVSNNLTIREFENSINASNGYVNSISKGIGEDKLSLIIENYPNLNIAWLLTGIGAMYYSFEGIVNGSGNQAIGGSTINVSESEIEYYRKRVSELEKLVEQKDKVIDVLSGK